MHVEKVLSLHVEDKKRKKPISCCLRWPCTSTGGASVVERCRIVIVPTELVVTSS